MNNENLKKGKATQFKAGEQQVKIARKGGLASAESRKRRKTASTIMRDALQQGFADGKLMDDLRDAGFEVDEPTTIGTAYVFSVLKSAMEGNAQAMKIVLALAGDDPEFNHKKEMDKLLMKLREREVESKEQGW